MTGDLDPDLYTLVGDAAQIVGVHPDTLRKWERRGRIRCLRTPANWRMYRLGDLYTLRDARRGTER
ncbi:MerR family DNA-binding transcriptional regulator [Nocardiopsis chromatogenes]|uniref:MerR family DNA-binding transcriptional regulator n=1 Tax=Nocardiopsis chromatogenes TaxID=280239 RepID=UPI000349721F|nr:MerR family DNA-binding transcriptional regulator [Nocardiopsis chromatogenes]